MSTNASKKKSTRSDEARAPRRGELEGIKASYKGISDFEEFHRLCRLLDAKEIKTRELEDLYKRGKVVTSFGTVKRYVYGERGASPGEWKTEPKAYLKMSAESYQAEKLTDKWMLLGLDAEEFMVDVILRCHRPPAQEGAHRA